MTPLNRRRTTDRTIVIPVKTGIQNKTPSRSDPSIPNYPFLIHNCLFPSPRDPDTLPKTHLKKQTQFSHHRGLSRRNTVKTESDSDNS